jgi:hypothetical protein
LISNGFVSRKGSKKIQPLAQFHMKLGNLFIQGCIFKTVIGDMIINGFLAFKLISSGVCEMVKPEIDREEATGHLLDSEV